MSRDSISNDTAAYPELKTQNFTYLSGVGLLSLTDFGLSCVGDLGEPLEDPCNLDLSVCENLSCLGVDRGCSLEADCIELSTNETDLGVDGCESLACLGVITGWLPGEVGSTKDTDLKKRRVFL